MKKKIQPPPEKLWTWAIKNQYGDWELCYFTFRTRKQLLSGLKPSPEAKPIRVLMRPL